MNWDEFDRGTFLVNCLGIVYDSAQKKVLIGKRENDPYLPQISWTFPGGRPRYGESFEDALRREVKLKTGLDVRPVQLVLARTLPEKNEFLLIYYFCEVLGGKPSAGEKFKEVKWVSPSEVQKHFTTSIHPRIQAFLSALV